MPRVRQATFAAEHDEARENPEALLARVPTPCVQEAAWHPELHRPRLSRDVLDSEMTRAEAQAILDAFQVAVDRSSRIRELVRGRPVEGMAACVAKIIAAERLHARHVLAAADRALAQLGQQSPTESVREREAIPATVAPGRVEMRAHAPAP
jgi:hypothetical protein